MPNFTKSAERGGEVEPAKPLYEQPVSIVGYEHSDGINGKVYRIGNMEFIVSRITDSELKVYSRRKGTMKTSEVVNPIVIKKALAEEKKNTQILEARKNRVQELAKGDHNLKQVLDWHQDFTDGLILEPVVKDGIAFYQVGRNSSHEFYAGTKGGKRYVYSIGESADDSDGFDENIREVEDASWGYMGHH